MKNRFGKAIEYKNRVNRISLIKEDEVYRFNFYEDNIPILLETLGRYASNPDLSFTWYDAAVLSQKVRDISQNIYEERLSQIDDSLLRSRIKREVERLMKKVDFKYLDYVTAFNEVIFQGI